MNKTGCESYQERDGTHYCGRCHLRWDNDSIDPPECLTDAQLTELKGVNGVWPPLPSPPRDSQRVHRKVSEDEQKEINRRGMAKLRETLNHE